MKLLDTNVWLALVLSGHHYHQIAHQWMQTQRGKDEVLFCRATQMSLLRLLTTSAVLRPFGNPPLTNEEAWAVYMAYIEDPRVCFAVEPRDTERHWHRLSSHGTASPKVWMDAYLAAFAISGGHQLVTTDNDFQQYEELDLLTLKL